MTTEPQHMTALAKANVMRKARAQLRAEVEAIKSFTGGCCELAEILADGVPACMATMRIEEVLRWPCGWRGGITRQSFINDVLDIVGCTEFRQMGDLTVRQRCALVNVLREVAGERLAA